MNSNPSKSQPTYPPLLSFLHVRNPPPHVNSGDENLILPKSQPNTSDPVQTTQREAATESADLPSSSIPSGFPTCKIAVPTTIPFNDAIRNPTQAQYSESVRTPATTSPPHTAPLVTGSTAEEPAWDYWPDGEFERHFMFDEWDIVTMGGFFQHWATGSSGQERKKGNADAENWQDGKRLSRYCRGVIRCGNPDCRILQRPKTTRERIAAQLTQKCLCGSRRVHITCDIKSHVYTYRGGKHLIHCGTHEHSRPPQEKHLTPQAKAKFSKMVHRNPTSGPAALLHGVPTLDGIGHSAADISPILVNKDRIAYERREVIRNHRGTKGGDSFVTAFTDWCKEHPNFVIDSILKDITVISMQTAYMASQAVKDTLAAESVNGIVSDAAHGFWRERTSVLIVSSVYVSRLHCWMPVMFSYANGTQAEHYKFHFLHLFRSIAKEAASHNITLSDELFSNVSINLPW